jgi:hypothetical protein
MGIWQEFAVLRPSCHWWQFFAIHKVPDMSIIALLVGIVIVLVVVLAVVATVRAIRTDGYRAVPTCPDARRVGLQ